MVSRQRSQSSSRQKRRIVQCGDNMDHPIPTELGRSLSDRQSRVFEPALHRRELYFPVPSITFPRLISLPILEALAVRAFAVTAAWRLGLDPGRYHDVALINHDERWLEASSCWGIWDAIIPLPILKSANIHKQ